MNRIFPRVEKDGDARRCARCAPAAPRIRRILITAALAAAALVVPGRAEKLRFSAPKQSLQVRLVGRAAPLPRSTFGGNEQSYIAAVPSGPDPSGALVRLVYRFLSYDRDLPAAFLDYELVHKFRAVRQPECDAVARSLLFSRRLLAYDRLTPDEFSFTFARNATQQTIPPERELPCYVVTPGDYQESHRIPVTAGEHGY
jgi:hypothetical protein